jgi:hypothetical protein
MSGINTMISFSSGFSTISSNRSAHAPIKFQGERATQLAKGKRLLPGEYLAMALRYERDPYVGKVPNGIQHELAGSEIEPKQLLEELAVDLSRNPLKRGRIQWYELGDKSLKLSYLGAGEDGRVYRLQLGPRSYAFKVFKTYGDPFEEAANGLYLTARKTRDVSRFYLANPSKKWMLTEYIGPETTLANRTGRTMEEQGFETNDDAHEPNRVNGILVDYGGELCVPRGYISQGDFENEMEVLGLIRKVKKVTQQNVNQVNSPSIFAYLSSLLPEW